MKIDNLYVMDFLSVKMKLLAAGSLDWKEECTSTNIRSVAYLFEFCNPHHVLHLLLIIIEQLSFLLLVCLLLIVFVIINVH